jgi:hypothetical protein
MFAPVPIDPTPGSELAGNGGSATFGVFPYNNALYVLISEADDSVNVYRSVDRGNTWAVLDAADRPTGLQAAVGCFDGAHTLYVGSVALTLGSLTPIVLQSFDLASGAWVPAFATSPAIAFGITGLFLRSDGSFAALYDSRNNGSLTVESSGLGCAIFNVTWTSFDAGAALLLLPGWDDTQTFVNASTTTAVLDSSNNLHVFFSTDSFIETPGAQWNNLYFYQQITAADGLGSFFQFPGQQPLTGPQDLPDSVANGRPIVIGANILFPVARNIPTDLGFTYPTIYVGTPLATPVWTLSPITTGIDPESLDDPPVNGTPTHGPFLSTDGNIIAAAWELNQGSGQGIRISQTSNLASPTLGWDASTVENGVSGEEYDFPFAFVFPVGQILLSSTFINFNPSPPSGSYWFGNFTPTPLAAPTFAPAPGSYPTPQTVILSGPTDAIICYRTDGVDPTASVPGTCDPGSITYTGPIDVLESETICAISTEVGQTNSNPNCATYGIAQTQPFAVILRGVKRFKTGPKEFICKPVNEQEHNAAVEKLTEWIG